MSGSSKSDAETVAERTAAGVPGVSPGGLTLGVRAGAQTAWHTLQPGRSYVLGRDEAADIPIAAPAASRQHARLTVSSLGVEVEDLGSRNGTKLNGRRIREAEVFRPGDELQVGGFVLTLHGNATDARPGLNVLDHGAFMKRVEEENDRSNRFRRPLALIVLEVGGEGTAASPGMLEVCERVREVLRPMDPIGHFGANRIEVLLPEADVSEALRVARRIETRMTTTEGGLHIGVATRPDDGTDREQLLQAALGRSRQAAGRGVIRLAGEGPEPSKPEGRNRSDVVVRSEAMRLVFELAERAAQSDITVLVEGETGVGKELVAEAIHETGPRRGGPLVRVNCAALPEHLVESELFGHERGSFTGALRAKPGFFEQAQSGTLFLDEIGEIPLSLQPKLLRVLETRKVRRIGATREVRVDVRVVAATNQNLQERVNEGLFRDDLYFRLAGISLRVPPLRERKSDIEPLALLFARKAAEASHRSTPSIPSAVLDRLRAYGWPGNVRELMNLVERAMLVSDGPALTIEDFPSVVVQESEEAGLRENLDAVERKVLIDALRSCEGNQTRAAKLLSMPRRTFIYKMKRLGITKRDYA